MCGAHLFGVAACTEPPARGPAQLVMPTPAETPARLDPVAEIVVNDSEDSRLVGTAAPELLGAVDAYREGNSQAALARFLEVMRDTLRPPVPRQLAQLFAAKALLKLELPHAAWMLLDEIASDPHHALRLRALPWLGVLASRVDADAVLSSMKGYTAADRDKLSDQSPALRERITYLLGRRAFLSGKDASALLGAVTADGMDYPKALFMLGVGDVRAKRLSSALQRFAAIDEAVVRPGLEDPQRIRALATMARARVLYELGGKEPSKLQEALALYETAVDMPGVEDDARIEKVWALVKLLQEEEALTELRSVRPTLRSRHAEADELEVLILLERCALPEAEASLDRAQTHHKEIVALIEGLLADSVASHIPAAVRLGAAEELPASGRERVIAIAARRTRLARALRRFDAMKKEKDVAAALPLDFRESKAGKKVLELVAAATARTDARVTAGLTSELTELSQMTEGYLTTFGELRVELEQRKASGCR